VFELIRIGYEPEQPQGTLIVIAVGFGAVIAIVLIVYLMKKR
jgi:hypothetical protein